VADLKVNFCGCETFREQRPLPGAACIGAEELGVVADSAGSGCAGIVGNMIKKMNMESKQQ